MAVAVFRVSGGNLANSRGQSWGEGEICGELNAFSYHFFSQLSLPTHHVSRITVRPFQIESADELRLMGACGSGEICWW
jgi:hypothetical protein